MAQNHFQRTAWCLATWAAIGFVPLANPAIAQDDLDNLESASVSAYEQGLQALQAEDFDTARQIFTDVIATAPADPRGYIGRATALAGLDLQQDALADFKTAMDYTNSPAPEARALRAETQFQRGKMYMDMGNQFVSTALPDLQAAREVNPADLRYAYQLGKAYAIASPFSPGAGEQAEPLLTQYLEENPDDAEAHRLRGTAYAAMNKLDEAFADLDRSIELDPSDHENYTAAATVYMTQDDYQKSADLFEKAIETYEPAEEGDDLPFSQGYLTLAAVYEELGKASDDPEEQKQGYTMSVETSDKLLKLLPDRSATEPAKAAALFRKGVGQRLLEQYGPAVTSLTEAIDLNPEMGEAYFRRAICFVKMNEQGLAIRDLKDAEALLFGDARPHLWEGISHAADGNYREAIRAYNTAISFSNRYVDPYLNRAHAYFQLGEYAGAIDSFNECIRLQPENPEYYYKRGICYQNLDEMDKAVQSYISAIQFNNQYAPAYDMLIPLLEQQGRNQLAEQYRTKRAAIGEPTAAKQ